MFDYVVLCGSLIHLPVSQINVQSEHLPVFGSLEFLTCQWLTWLYMVKFQGVVGFNGNLGYLVTTELVLITKMDIKTIMSLLFSPLMVLVSQWQWLTGRAKYKELMGSWGHLVKIFRRLMLGDDRESLTPDNASHAVMPWFSVLAAAVASLGPAAAR